MTDQQTRPVPAVPPTPPPPPEPVSLVQRITALEDQIQRIYAMMARDREWMNELGARIGLP